MLEPIWIEKDIVIALHNRHLAEFGGRTGFINENLLESALARPKNLFTYKKTNISFLAAAYAFSITKNHPFIDGNKRTSLIVCFLFLEINGYIVQATQEAKYQMFLQIANNNLSENVLAEWIEHNLTAI